MFPTSTNFDFLITNDNILIDLKEYQIQKKILGNFQPSDLQNVENKLKNYDLK